jgi:hypothetical protein
MLWWKWLLEGSITTQAKPPNHRLRALFGIGGTLAKPPKKV